MRRRHGQATRRPPSGSPSATSSRTTPARLRRPGDAVEGRLAVGPTPPQEREDRKTAPVVDPCRPQLKENPHARSRP
jgi:hypothetical protein